MKLVFCAQYCYSRHLTLLYWNQCLKASCNAFKFWPISKSHKNTNRSSVKDGTDRLKKLNMYWRTPSLQCQKC